MSRCVTIAASSGSFSRNKQRSTPESENTSLNLRWIVRRTLRQKPAFARSPALTFSEWRCGRAVPRWRGRAHTAASSHRVGDDLVAFCTGCLRWRHKAFIEHTYFADDRAQREVTPTRGWSLHLRHLWTAWPAHRRQLQRLPPPTAGHARIGLAGVAEARLRNPTNAAEASRHATFLERRSQYCRFVLSIYSSS